jgi:hypothetical protein
VSEIVFNPNGVSDELKQSRRWVLFQVEDVQDGIKLRKSMKPPYNARTGFPAKHNDPTTWSSYDEARAAHEQNLPLHHGLKTVKVHEQRGIGCVIGPPFFAIDIDHCRDPLTGVIQSWAATAIEEIASLTEISPSGCGVHIWCHGEPPYLEGHRKDDIEIYSSNRYLTITGHVLPGCEQIRRFTPSEVKALYDRVKAGRSSSEKPRELPRNTEFGARRIDELMNATDFADASQHVMSLLTLLAIKHCGDREKIEAEFKQSAVYNTTHWKTEKWERLGEAHLDKAVAYAKDNLEKRKSNDIVVTLDEIGDDEATPKPLVYAWDPVLPLGKLVHFGGRSSEGKSPVTIDLIARISRGATFPNGAPNGFGGARKSILLNIEDGFEDVILPRYYLAGGVKGMLRYMRGVKIAKGDSLRNGLIALDRDIHLLCERARQIDDLGLIVLDPCTNYLGKLKMNAEEDVRQILTPLAGIAEELNIVVITVGHLNKSESKDPLSRMMGAAAFAGVARSVYLFAHDDTSESPYAHVMSPARGQMGESLKYRTELVEQEFDGGAKGKVVRVEWDGVSTQTAEDGTNPVTRRQLSQEKEAAVALRDYLKGGKKSSVDCLAFLKAQGSETDKLNPTRVRELAGVRFKREGNKSNWFLPSAQQEFEVPIARREDSSPEF